MAKIKEDPTKQVTDFLENLDHPFKTEVQEIRKIIMGVDPQITEEVKWNAPSFSSTDYLATFNLHVIKHVHLVFHNPRIVQIESAILEGKYKDRRMVFFTSMDDVKSKAKELERIVAELVDLTARFPTVPKEMIEN